MKDKRKRFKIDLFNYDVHVVWSNDLPKHRRALATILYGDDSEVENNFDGCHMTDGGGRSFILLPHNPPPHISVHEISHCVDAIVNFCSADCPETKAHLFGYIASKIL